MDYSAAHELARQIRESPEAAEYRQLKAVAEESETTRALLREYRRLQMTAQELGTPHAAARAAAPTATSSDPPSSSRPAACAPPAARQSRCRARRR